MSTLSSPTPHHTAPLAPARPTKRPRVYRELTVCVYDNRGNVIERAIVQADGPHPAPDAGTPLLCKTAACTCQSQAAIMRFIGYTGSYVWSYEDPGYLTGDFDEAYDVVGPLVCFSEVLRFGKINFDNDIVIHATPDEKESPHVHEIILDIDSATTHSAYCAKCKCRTTFNDKESTCHVCDTLVVCPHCTESIWSNNGCEICDNILKARACLFAL